MSTSNVAPRSIARAEPVGSLLRPPSVTERILSIYAGKSTASPGFALPERATELGELARLIDPYVADVVRRQAASGLDVVTDGEFRRTTFLGSLLDAVAGSEEAQDKDRMTDDAGNVVYEGFADPVISQRLHKVRNPLVEEVASLRAVTAPVPFKVTIPAPSYFFTQIVQVSPRTSYGDRQEIVNDIVELERELVAEAIAAGATWIQFDFPVYPALCDEAYAKQMGAEFGYSADDLLTRAIDADTLVAQDIPDGVTTGLHICRGNLEGGFWNGSLEPVAERMFGELPFDRYLIEWEDLDREGDYAPIRFAPKGKVVALGLVSTKTPEVESDDDIVRELERASEHLGIEQLGLCPQCGFASLFEDHLVGADDVQWAKLDLVGRVADRVWGRG